MRLAKLEISAVIGIEDLPVAVEVDVSLSGLPTYVLLRMNARKKGQEQEYLPL